MDPDPVPSPRGPRPFFTRSPELAPLRALVREHATLAFDRADLASVFRLVDEYCAGRFPEEHRGEWFSPLFLGGADIRHTPPHLICAVYAIYSDLREGSPEPVPYLAGPLDLEGATAIQLEPSAGFLVTSCLGEDAPLTDVLVKLPARLKAPWVSDIYGIPETRSTVIALGWNAASVLQPTAAGGGYLMVHPGARRVLDPMAPAFTYEEESLFFAERPHEGRLERYRERIAEQFGAPLPFLQRNHDHVRRVVEGYLRTFP